MPDVPAETPPLAADDSVAFEGTAFNADQAGNTDAGPPARSATADGAEPNGSAESAGGNGDDSGDDHAASPASPAPASTPARKRPKPGERRVQILQTLAEMLQQPGAERITTAALAGKLQVSEAALYRHFASKAQMFEGLIDFIEGSVFTLVNQIVEREPQPALQAQKIAQVLLQFGEKNPGMTRVMVGDALVFEHERLSARMNQFFDRVESQLRQSLRAAAEARGSSTPTVDAQVLASALTSLVVGRLQRYARSGFKRLPTEQVEPALQRLTA